MSVKLHATLTDASAACPRGQFSEFSTTHSRKKIEGTSFIQLLDSNKTEMTTFEYDRFSLQQKIKRQKQKKHRRRQRRRRRRLPPPTLTLQERRRGGRHRALAGCGCYDACLSFYNENVDHLDTWKIKTHCKQDRKTLLVEKYKDLSPFQVFNSNEL